MLGCQCQGLLLLLHMAILTPCVEEIKLQYLKADEVGVSVLLYDVANGRHTLPQCNLFCKPAVFRQCSYSDCRRRVATSIRKLEAKSCGCHCTNISSDMCDVLQGLS